MANVSIGEVTLGADIQVPDDAIGVVLFAHGSGSSRHSSRNRHVAEILNRGAMATILIDLLTSEEEVEDLHTAQLRFNIPMLGRRVASVTEWVSRDSRLKKLGLGYFGASTGAAAALVAASERPEQVRAVVSRGGRPDLAGLALLKVTAPTLFIVGGEDRVVLDLNRSAIAMLPPGTPHKLEIIPGATHLFEELGALDRVAELAREWFREYFSAGKLQNCTA